MFAAAGDLIGASTFESFIQHDKPTLDALNEAGLDVSAAGNHEFDAGYNDLVNRVMQPESASNPEGGADWQYLAANVRKKSDNSYALPDVAASPGTSDGATWYDDFGGVEVGFVGAVTEDLPSPGSPAGIADIKVTSIVAEINAAADRLKADGADIVVLLVHEGAADHRIASATDTLRVRPDRQRRRLRRRRHRVRSHAPGLQPHRSPAVPVVSAGQYGPTSTSCSSRSTTRRAPISAGHLRHHVPQGARPTPAAPNYPADPASTTIVDDAKAEANVLGAVGSARSPVRSAGPGSPTAPREPRWRVHPRQPGGRGPALGDPDARGRRRADRLHEPGRAARGHGRQPRRLPGHLTYKQAAVVQPFANTLVNMKLTGAQIKTVLEQQWQRDAGGAVPSRPFLRLGTSEGFFATYDATRAEGDRITGMWLNGKAIEPATAYSVTVNSFLASGGDNFRGFTAGTGKRDTGKVDLQAMVDYMAANAEDHAAGGRPEAAPGGRDLAGHASRGSTASARTSSVACPRWR